MPKSANQDSRQRSLTVGRQAINDQQEIQTKTTIDAFCTPVGKTSGRDILALIHQCYPFLLLPIPALFIDEMFDCSILAAFHQCGAFLLI